RVNALLLSFAVAAAASCAQQGPDGTNNGPSPSRSGGSSGGGEGGSGGRSSQGAGGSTGGNSGGSQGSSSGGSTGGSGTGGTTAPPTGTGGTSGGTGGTSGGTGGTTAPGTGGTSGGTPDAAPPVDMGGGGGELTPAAIVPDLDGYLWVGVCSAGAGAGLDCVINNDMGQCPNTENNTPFAMRGAFRTKVIDVKGDPTKKYMINFEVRGVAGGKYYTGGKQRTTTGYTAGPGGNDGWYEGGTPTDSRWNTYELYVEPKVEGAPNTYFFNAFPPASGYDGRHETYVMNYKASFPAMGGSKLRFVIHDSNCLGQQNCGQTVQNQQQCTNPRTVPLTGMNPQPPSTFMQPYRNSDFFPQWLYFDVQSVTLAP
ncbi:MAG TPA: hypothetical protein VGF45_21240, partial [Polyangia bacterium]